MYEMLKQIVTQRSLDEGSLGVRALQESLPMH